jgi:hypothetical protein
MAFCICCQSEVDIVARLTTHAGLPADANPIDLQYLVSQHAWQRYQLALETWDINVPWDVCFRCYVFSGAERYYPFSMCPQFRY